MIWYCTYENDGEHMPSGEEADHRARDAVRQQQPPIPPSQRQQRRVGIHVLCVIKGNSIA